MRWLRSIRLNWGLRPQTPGIYRLRARMAYCGGGRSRLLPFRLLSRRSGCVPALPYPPLRYFQSGSHQPRRAMIFHRAATNPLNFLSHWRGSPQRVSRHSGSVMIRCAPKVWLSQEARTTWNGSPAAGVGIDAFGGERAQKVAQARELSVGLFSGATLFNAPSVEICKASVGIA